MKTLTLVAFVVLSLSAIAAPPPAVGEDKAPASDVATTSECDGSGSDASGPKQTPQAPPTTPSEAVEPN